MLINYYSVKVTSIPSILFAHSFHTDGYEYERSLQYNHFEISSMEQGVVHRHYNYNVDIDIPEYSISIQFPSKDCLFSQTCADYHSHNTVGFVCENTIAKISKEEIIELTNMHENSFPWESEKDSSISFIFPNLLLPSDDTIKVRNLCKQIIQEFNTTNPKLRQLACVSSLFSLFKLLTDISCKQILEQQAASRRYVPANALYAKQAMLYINAHVDEKISTDQIANHLGISVGYLSNIFKQETHQTLIKYINNAKIKKIIDLVNHQNMSFYQAGKVVGIEDAPYLSRLFKKTYGISYRDYIDHFKKFERHNGS
ncbi:MAG: helix-turn-helix transcriptional regulator [Ruminococcaceae bacterium]|nr:helix-turn-helix transcriptional regulator [Oscillospiraceae bacterium]